MESLEHNWANISETICPQNANFWQVSILDVVFSDYLDKFHKFTYFIFMTSSLQDFIGLDRKIFRLKLILEGL